MEDAGTLASKPAPIPFAPSTKLHVDQVSLIHDASSFRKLIGRMLYLTTTRPDVCYSVQHLSQFVFKPLLLHFQAGQRILQYVKESPAKGIFCSTSNPLKLHGFTDSNWHVALSP